MTKKEKKEKKREDADEEEMKVSGSQRVTGGAP